MTTANDLILGALKFINEYAPGESLDSADADDALETLKAAWVKQGCAVDITSAEQQDQQVHARIRLRAG